MTGPETLPSPRSTVEVIYAGGTISSLQTEGGVRVGGHALNLVGILEERFPGYEPDFEVNYAKEVAWTGLSENMDPSDWETIDAKIVTAFDRNPNGVLVTHGTDSMEQTANHFRLRFLPLLQEKNARLILTGSNDDIYTEGTDAWENIGFGLSTAASDIPPDVYVAYHGRVIPADKVTKLPYIPGGELTFVSIDDPLYESSLQTQQKQANKLITDLIAAYGRQPDTSSAIVYNVNVIRSNHNELLDYLASHASVRNVLLNLYHSGTAHTEKPDQSVAELVRKLKPRGITFFGATENGEIANLRAYVTSVELRNAGVVPLYDILKDVALVKLQLLDPNLTPRQQIDEMLHSKVGELDESKIVQKDITKLKTLYRQKKAA
jgi:L-asparaginase/Glu-tRNA(Gln) amidotransferase subunit D